VSQIVTKLFTGSGGEKVVQNKGFKFARDGTPLASFLESTVAAQGPEKRH
jgi:hypothetical protein